MSEYPKVLVKGKKKRTAENASEEVAAKFEGFKVEPKASPAPAKKVQEK